MSPRQIMMQGLFLGVLAALLGAGALFTYVHWYTRSDRIFPGVMVGSMPVGGLPVREARGRLAQAALPAVADPQALAYQAVAVGRQGPVWQQTRLFLTSAVHGHYVPLPRPVSRPVSPATAEYAGPPDLSGLAAQAGPIVGPALPNMERRTMAAPEMRYQIARFTTPILSADPGRVQNIGLAAQKIDGVVVGPGQFFSFNERVGPRDAVHGWAQANEIYQGEYVMGYGGGICQVSSTLYNAVLLGGLEIAARHHHDRPLQYIDPGRDATVAWNLLDFRFRNSTDMPVQIRAVIHWGSPHRIEVALQAPRALPEGAIHLEESERRYEPPPMEEVYDPTLPPDTREVVSEGRPGIEVKVYRVIRQGDQIRRELVSHDRYLPKSGKVRVGIGHAPGSQRLQNPGLF